MLIWRVNAALPILGREPAPKPASGWDVGADILQALGRQTLRLEREFNRRAGFTAAPRAVDAPQAVFDVSESDLDAIFAGMSNGYSLVCPE